MLECAKANAPTSNTIALNKKAKHEYHIEERFEAGLALLGWEVKSLRAGKAQLVDAYVLLKDGEAWLLGSHITPLNTASTHVIATDPHPQTAAARQGNRQDCRPGESGGLHLHSPRPVLEKNKVKCEIALVKGKKLFDKRATEKERDWNRQKQRIMREANT